MNSVNSKSSYVNSKTAITDSVLKELVKIAKSQSKAGFVSWVNSK